MQPFVHLHVHSEYSLLDGLSRIDHLAGRAKALNMPALALTDHGAMFGAIQFYRACHNAGVRPILGIESYLAARGMADRDPQLDRDRFHLLLLAQDQTGYQNLLHIASDAQLHGFYYRPRIDRDYLAAHAAGLIASTGCMAGEIPRAIQAGQPDRAYRLMDWYVDLFGRDRFFVELQEHSIPELTAINKTLVEMAGRYNLRLVATNDVHYTTADEAGPHDVLLCIQTGKGLATRDRLRLSDQGYYLKSRAEMARLFSGLDHALDNSLLIAEMCHVNPIPEGYHLPLFDVPAGFTADSYLRHLCEQGLAWRYGAQRAADDVALRQRLDHELNVIHTMGFDTYFLVVWDLCQFARQADIWWNVRGSGAGSVVAYSLGVTALDPLAHGLIFERFLNPGRVSMPDIDLDYPDDRRHEMIDYTVRKYGSDKVAQIITFGTMGARAAIRDVGRALEVPLPDVDSLARLIPSIPGKPVTIANALDPQHEFYSADLKARYQEDEQARQLVDTARSLEGVVRHASTHAAGVVITDRPLVEYAPLHRPTSGDGNGDAAMTAITQWPMEIVDSIGLLKVDFLGLATLTIMRQAAELIARRHGLRYTMDNIPYDQGQVGPDPEKRPQALFDLLGRGEVAGVFQVEGAGMRRLMMDMRPQRFDHIVAAISLYRPGPMENIPEYIARMHGDKEVRYHHPDLEPVLAETYGILVYQEQIILIASLLAGYAPGEADSIRKAVGKKIRSLIDKHRATFIDGAMKRGYSRPVCEAIWGDIEYFARYGFNKSHAADYAVITCQTAFLKAHYPVEYVAALLSVERHNTAKVSHYLADARRLGITVAPPSINQAGLDFTIEEDETPPGPQRSSETSEVFDAHRPVIRYGLGAIKNAGEGAMDLVLQERAAAGPFQSLADLCQRVDLRRVGKRALESMIKVGVFDQWGSRPQLLDAVDRLVSHSGGAHEARAAGQLSLFGGLAGPALNLAVELLRPQAAVPPVDQRELLQWEKELLGVYLSEHPLNRFLDLLQNVTTATTAELDEMANGRAVVLAGVITSVRTLTTKKGEPMAFAMLEDLQGGVELIFFPRTWKECRAHVRADQLLLVRGKLKNEGEERGGAKVLVDSVDPNPTLALEESRPVAAESSPPAELPHQPPAATPDDAFPFAGNGDEKSWSPLGEENGPYAAAPPPPPPNFDDDAAYLPAEPLLAAMATAAPPPQSRIIVVEVEPVNGWQETFRQALAAAAQFTGDDTLSLVLVGKNLAMDFPHHPTAYRPELVEALRGLTGVRAVRAP